MAMGARALVGPMLLQKPGAMEVEESQLIRMIGIGSRVRTGVGVHRVIAAYYSIYTALNNDCKIKKNIIENIWRKQPRG